MKNYFYPTALGLLIIGGLFVNASNGTGSKRKVIFTTEAPKPIGPYSQAILTGNTLYLAGQVGIDPASGKLDSTGIEGETRRALKNLTAVLQAAGMNMSHVTKTTIYLKNVKDFAKVNEIYATFFTNGAPPARETV